MPTRDAAHRPTLDTERLTLVALAAADLDAWLTGDAAALARGVGARFPGPADLPPLFGEDMPWFRARLRKRPTALGWGVWIILLRTGGVPVGVVGFLGEPDAEGRFGFGYSVYPEHTRQGYATEAARGALAWAFAQPGALLARATIPPWNTASLRVAEKLEMQRAGTAQDEEVGEVLVFEKGTSGAG